MDEYSRAVVILIGLATAILGWWHAKRTSLNRVQGEVEAQRGLLIEAMDHRLAEQERLYMLRIGDLERRLKVCEDRWNAPIGGQPAPSASGSDG